MELTLFIYGLVDPRTAEIRYVGVSWNPKKRLNEHVTQGRNPKYHHDYWVRELLAEDLRPEVTILERVEPGGDWAACERSWILFGRGKGWPLTNMSEGGEGPHSGATYNRTIRPKAPLSQEARDKISRANTGSKVMSDAVKQKWQDPEFRARMLAAFNNPDKKEAQRSKMRANRAKRVHQGQSAETRRRISEGHKRRAAPLVEREVTSWN